MLIREGFCFKLTNTAFIPRGSFRMVLKKLLRERYNINRSYRKVEAILALRKQVCYLLWEDEKGQSYSEPALRKKKKKKNYTYDSSISSATLIAKLWQALQHWVTAKATTNKLALIYTMGCSLIRTDETIFLVLLLLFVYLLKSSPSFCLPLSNLN